MSHIWEGLLVGTLQPTGAPRKLKIKIKNFTQWVIVVGTQGQPVMYFGTTDPFIHPWREQPKKCTQIATKEAVQK